MAKLNLVLILCFIGTIQAGLIPGYKRGIPSGNWYFKFYVTPKTWNEATLVCQSENGQLAVINSPEEAKLYVDEFVLQSPTPGNNKNSVMLGFHKRLGDDKFVAWDGTPLAETGYSSWAPGEPSGGNERCGSMLRDGKLNDVPCDLPLMFICESAHPFIGEPAKHEEPRCATYELGYKLGASKGDRFFKLHTTPKTWDEASLVCQTEHARLAIINSDEEAKIFSDEINKRNNQPGGIPGDFYKNSLMLGFHNRLTGKFMTLNGETLKDAGYEKWAKGQPDNNGNKEHCGSMVWDGTFNDVPCDLNLMFFCEKPFIVRPTKTCNYWEMTNEELTEGVPCETYFDGYKLNTVQGNQKHFYKFHINAKSWDEALLTCQSEHATLAVINSDAEAKMYSNEMAKYPADSIPGSFDKNVAMLGFHDRLTKGIYVTVAGTPLAKTGYSKWAPGQPDNTGNAEHCGSMYRSGLLNDLKCDSPYVFFCERVAGEYCSVSKSEKSRNLP